jgi:CDP-6-deoxy-D-xylo-4-hexulose-3-dehydrase
VCTNNKNIYRIIRMLRSHGMVRESGDLNYENKLIKKYKYLSPKFIFLYPGFNMRNNEIGAVIGLNQLKRLDSNNKKRSKNIKFFLRNLNSEIYHTNYDLIGNSNYAFPLILKKKNLEQRNKLENTMIKNKIEFRRGNAGGGNQLRQPYLKNHIKNINMKKFKNVEHIHDYGYYIGNFPELKKNKILKITNVLNSINER